MKLRILTPFASSAAAILAATLLLATTASAGSGDPPSLQGTWRVQVTLYNCANPNMKMPPFWSLLSFHRGGTATETTSNPALQPSQRTPGHGFWQPFGDSSYFVATEAFILFDSPTTPPGIKKGVQKILQVLSLTDENNFTSAASVKFFNADGTVTTGCANATGTRLTGSASEP